LAKALSVLALAGLALLASAATPIPVSSAPTGASEPIPEAFVSYSIEFAFFPDFAGGVSCHCQMFLFLHAIGNISHPNTFSYNLLTNIGHLAGTNPYIRVGGNTQDYALYNASLKKL